MLEVKDLSVSIGSTPILRQATITLATGEMVGLIGRNGAGKTTFQRAIMGVLAAQSGQITFDHFELLKLPAQTRASLGIGYMPEDRKLVPALTSEENIMIPVWSLRIPDWEDRLKWIYSLIPEAADLKDRPSTSLSGGQQKLIALARALMVGNKLLMC